MASHVKCRNPWLAILVLALLVVSPLQLTHAQAVQAVKQMQTAEPIYSEGQVDRLAKAVNVQINALMSLKEEIGWSNVRALQDLVPAIDNLMEEGINLLAGARESSEFMPAYLAFRDNHRKFSERWDRTIARNFETYGQYADLPAAYRLRNLPVPKPQGASLSSVTFTLGLSQHIAKERSAVNMIDIQTSLFGDVLGAVAGFFGSNMLQEYFSKNLSIGASIPTHGDNKVVSGFGLGLGELRQRGLRMWPVVGLMQRDGADTRFLGDLQERFPAEETWSAPMVTVAFAFDRSFDPIRQNRIGPIFTLGLQFQQYYPGNAFSAVGALFTNEISKYEKSGNLGFSFGIAVPIMQGNRR